MFANRAYLNHTTDGHVSVVFRIIWVLAYAADNDYMDQRLYLHLVGSIQDLLGGGSVSKT
jgi:hypothetical protein